MFRSRRLTPRLVATFMLLFLTGFIIWETWDLVPRGLNSLHAQYNSHGGNELFHKLWDMASQIKKSRGYSNLPDVRNRTLGFEKIYILSMPSRTDKRDALVLSAHVSGLDIEFADGVNGTEMSKKETPYRWPRREPIGTLGCWRGHMNIYQKMVRERISTALIIEDDADWDIFIKAQMTEFARGTRFIRQASSSPHSPYGDGWDVMSLGHCGIGNRPHKNQYYWVTDHDPTIPNEKGNRGKPNTTPRALSGPHKRLVFDMRSLQCTLAYAISLQGAQRVIYDQQMVRANFIDLALSSFCKRSSYGRKACLGVYPQIFGMYTPAGDSAKTSDRVEKTGTNKHAFSRQLVFSTMMNLENLLRGETVVHAQYPEKEMLGSADLSTFRFPRGNPVFVKTSEYRR
ncbi:hypothetical protein B0O99DRAFT_287006 [Bisporella sp. PMI_857]|nr:hypothetical protein B0O99DRAFT_287006 [Bisporella sp. PMI_857]